MKNNILLSLCISSTFASMPGFATNILVDHSVPKGFEEIAKLNRVYDVYLNNQYAGSTLIENVENKSSFNQIGSVLLNMKGNIKDRNDLKTALSKSFASNKLTINRETEQLYITIDNLKRTINVSQKKLNGKSNIASIGSGFSWKSNLRGDLSFNKDQDSSKSIYWNSSIAYNQNSFHLTSTMINDNYQVDNAYFSREINNDRLNLGVGQIDTRTYGSMANHRFIGLNYLFDTKNTESQQNRRPIELTLIKSAKIKVYRNKELLHVSQKPAGPVVINTNNFPAGNFNAKVTIEYDDGQEITLSKFVTTNYNRIGKDGFTGLSLGFINKNHQYFDTGDYDDTEIAARLSYRKSLNPYFTSYLNIGYENNNFIINPSLNIEFNGGHAQSSLLRKNNGQWLFDNFATYQFGNHDFTAGLNKRHFDTFESNVYGRYQYRNEKLGRFMFSLNKSSLYDKPRYQATYDTDLYHDQKQSLNLRTILSYQDETYAGIELTYRLGPSGSKFNYIGSAIGSNNGKMFKHGIQHRHHYQDGYITTSANAISSNSIGNRFVQTALSDYRYGQARAQFGSKKTVNGYQNYGNASFDISFAGDESKAVILGKKHVNTGIILDLTSQEKDKYILHINDKKVYLSGGEKHTLSLPAHKKYRFSLTNDSNPNVKVEDNIQELYLYSNNLAFLSWNINHVTLFSGRAIKDNKPLINKPVVSSVGTGFTDENGFFTIEINKDDKILKISNNKCNIIDEEDHLSFNDIKCSGVL